MFALPPSSARMASQRWQLGFLGHCSKLIWWMSTRTPLAPVQHRLWVPCCTGYLLMLSLPSLPMASLSWFTSTSLHLFFSGSLFKCQCSMQLFTHFQVFLHDFLQTHDFLYHLYKLLYLYHHSHCLLQSLACKSNYQMHRSTWVAPEHLRLNTTLNSPSLWSLMIFCWWFTLAFITLYSWGFKYILSFFFEDRDCFLFNLELDNSGKAPAHSRHPLNMSEKVSTSLVTLLTWIWHRASLLCLRVSFFP